jgi:hypothetical protein
MRQKADLRPQVVQQIIAAVDASGLSRQDYEIRVQTTDPRALELLGAALDAVDQTRARQVATARAFEASGKSLQEFADMYGLDAADVQRAIDRIGR